MEPPAAAAAASRDVSRAVVVVGVLTDALLSYVAADRHVTAPRALREMLRLGVRVTCAAEPPCACELASRSCGDELSGRAGTRRSAVCVGKEATDDVCENEAWRSDAPVGREEADDEYEDDALPREELWLNSSSVLTS